MVYAVGTCPQKFVKSLQLFIYFVGLTTLFGTGSDKSTSKVVKTLLNSNTQLRRT